jgi:hypothetical protein
MERLAARRRRKARQRYLEERERQKALSAQDAQSAIRDAARGSAGAQQGMFGQNQDLTRTGVRLYRTNTCSARCF